MRPRKAKANTIPIWAVDCETDPFEYGRIPEPFLWGVYEGYSERYWEFQETDELVGFLREWDVIAYAHNGGKFDWHFMTRHLDPTRPLLVINGRLARFEIGKCEFRDSFNLMPISLDQYQKSEIEYWKFEKPVRQKYMEEIRTYLKSDCVNLWNMVNGFEKEFGRHLTQASAAMKIWQKRAKRTAPNSGPAFYDLMHPYYYGGRVQCFEAGDFTLEVMGKPARSADINSAYPTAMLSKHPISISYAHGMEAPDVKRKDWGPMMFTVRAVARGGFPYRGLNKMLYFPADDVPRTYHITGWELLAALETDTVEQLKILHWYRFTETADFSDYVLHFWDERKKAKAAGDKGRDYYCKIFLNGLYGKFASDPREYRQYEILPRDQLANVINSEKDFDFFREWLLVSEQVRKDQYRFYNLATAASITGLVRANLWRTIHASKHPFYCDTDNVTALDYPADLKIGPELGEWQVEYSYDRLVICGKKMYAFHKEGYGWEDSADRRVKFACPFCGSAGKLKTGCKVCGGKGVSNWKKATKGANLAAKDLIEIAQGKPIKFHPMVPTFSVHKSDPRFIPRQIKMTAADVTTVSRQFDPEFVKSVTVPGME